MIRAASMRLILAALVTTRAVSIKFTHTALVMIKQRQSLRFTYTALLMIRAV